MQSPPIQQKQHHQETTTRTLTIAAVAAAAAATTTTADNKENRSEVGFSIEDTTSNLRSFERGESLGTPLDSEEIEAASAGGENEATKRRGIINEEVTTISNDNNSNSNNNKSSSRSSRSCSSSCSVELGQQRELSRGIPHSSSQVADTSLERTFQYCSAPRASVGVVVVEVDNNNNNNETGSAIEVEVADLTASSSANLQRQPSNQDQSIATSSRLKQGSNELPPSLPCSSTITSPNRHQPDQSVSLKLVTLTKVAEVVMV